MSSLGLGLRRFRARPEPINSVGFMTKHQTNLKAGDGLFSLAITLAAAKVLEQCLSLTSPPFYILNGLSTYVEAVQGELTYRNMTEGEWLCAFGPSGRPLYSVNRVGSKDAVVLHCNDFMKGVAKHAVQLIGEHVEGVTTGMYEVRSIKPLRAGEEVYTSIDLQHPPFRQRTPGQLSTKGAQQFAFHEGSVFPVVSISPQGLYTLDTGNRGQSVVVPTEVIEYKIRQEGELAEPLEVAREMAGLPDGWFPFHLEASHIKKNFGILFLQQFTKGSLRVKVYAATVVNLPQAIALIDTAASQRQRIPGLFSLCEEVHDRLEVRMLSTTEKFM